MTHLLAQQVRHLRSGPSGNITPRSFFPGVQLYSHKGYRLASLKQAQGTALFAHLGLSLDFDILRVFAFYLNLRDMEVYGYAPYCIQTIEDESI